LEAVSQIESAESISLEAVGELAVSQGIRNPLEGTQLQSLNDAEFMFCPAV